jgi:hypothetical protein
MNKQGSHKFHMQMGNLKKLNEAHVKAKCRVEFSNGFVTSKVLDC